MKCESCRAPLKTGDDYIEYEGDRYCGDCYEGYTYTTYTVCGEYLATNDDGVMEYSKWDEENIK